MYYGLKSRSMLGGVRIFLVESGPFNELWQARSQIGIRVIENPPDLRTLILHLWRHSMEL
jgi:hypothetical protein